MKIGLDFDGCLDHMPEFFRVLAVAFVGAGHEVHVITYRDTPKETEAELRRLGIPFTKLHLPEDCRKVHAPEWKAKLAGELELDLFFEDSLENLVVMPPGVKRVWVADPEAFNMQDAINGMRKGFEDRRKK